MKKTGIITAGMLESLGINSMDDWEEYKGENPDTELSPIAEDILNVRQKNQ